MRDIVKIVSAFMVSVGMGLSVGQMLGPSAAAQQPTAAPPAVAAPKDELVDAWLDTAKVAAQLANSQCAQLESVKQMTRIQQEVTRKVEARLPGWTVDWQAFALARKPAAK